MTAFAFRALPAAVLLAVATVLPAAAGVVNTAPLNIDARVITFTDYNAITSADYLQRDLDVGSSETGEQVLLNSNDNEYQRILGQVTQGFGANGGWATDGAFAGLNNVSGYLSFTFSRGLNFVGGLFNYTPGGDSSTTLQALDINGSVIEDLQLTFTGSNGELIGFTSATANIYGLQMSGNFVAVDNLTFGTMTLDAGVPEPSVLLLVATSLGLLAYTQRRRLQSRAS